MYSRKTKIAKAKQSGTPNIMQNAAMRIQRGLSKAVLETIDVSGTSEMA